MKSMRVLAIVAAAILATSLAGAAPRKLPKTDTIWVLPDFASLGIERIAVLPISSFDKRHETEKQVEVSFGLEFKDVGYRWVSAGTSRELLRARASGSDSIVKVVKDELLKADRVDSLRAQTLCGWFRCDAVLGIRVDLWDRQELEWNQSGKPTTSVRLRASLVDSLGRVVWTAIGSERGEGSYNDPNASVTGLSVSGLETKPITAQAGAPKFAEVLAPLFSRWRENFPPPAPPAPPPAPPAPPPAEAPK